jgi:hypothetical protein
MRYGALQPHFNPSTWAEFNRNVPAYAPWLEMLAGIDSRFTELVEIARIRAGDRLWNQSYQKFAYRFPAQTLFVPQKPREQIIDMTMNLRSHGSDIVWTPAGCGVTHDCTMEIFQSSVDAQGQNLFRWHIRGKPNLLESPGLLAYAHGPEGFLSDLKQAHWAVRYPGDAVFRSIEVQRYEGYLQTEELLEVTRSTQTHIESCLPPCYPYSRRMFALKESGLSTDFISSDVIRNIPIADEHIQIVSILATGTDLTWGMDPQQGPLVINAVPATQMQVRSEEITRLSYKTGDSVRVTFPRETDCFAAIALEGARTLPCHFTVDACPLPGFDGNAVFDIHVTAPVNASATRIFTGCRGERVNFIMDSQPVHSTDGQPFTMYLPPIGGVDASCWDGQPLSHALGPRSLLTEGDACELLARLPSCSACFDINRVIFRNEGLDLAENPPSPWSTFLWPSILPTSYFTGSSSEAADVRMDGYAQTLRLRLPVQLSLTPAYLLQDIARHAADTLSCYHMFGLYRIEASVEDLE